MAALVKFVGGQYHVVQITFIRAFIGIILVLPLILVRGREEYRSKDVRLQISRSCLGGVAMLCTFYAYTSLPLSESTALNFTKPLFILPLAAIMFADRVGSRVSLLMLGGFVGVLLIVKPSLSATSFPAIIALCAAALVALVTLLTKRLSQTDSPLTSLLYFAFTVALITSVPALYLWQTPSWTDAVILGMVGMLGVCGQGCSILAYRVGRPSAISVAEYLQMPLAVTLGYYVFAERPDLISMSGAALIVCCAYLIVRRQSSERPT